MHKLVQYRFFIPDLRSLFLKSSKSDSSGLQEAGSVVALPGEVRCYCSSQHSIHDIHTCASLSLFRISTHCI